MAGQEEAEGRRKADLQELVGPDWDGVDALGDDLEEGPRGGRSRTLERVERNLVLWRRRKRRRTHTGPLG